MYYYILQVSAKKSPIFRDDAVKMEVVQWYNGGEGIYQYVHAIFS